MSYQVIARKWRPQTFNEVTGQEPITRTLRNAIEHERLHHAYLFSGARGVGKTTTARLLAKALNCHKSDRPTPVPCRIDDPAACASCREIAEGRSIDVLEIDAASNTGVDNVREAIIGNVAIAPARDRYKVFIIDEVHMLSGAAFNALLKTLEEPPPRVTFIMATTELHKLPDTILSRCQQFEFRTIAIIKISERLRQIADAEKISISDDALREIARAGEGSMRDAQSAFDQVISFSGTEIKAEDVEAALGLAGAEMLARIIGAITEQRPSEALAVVDDLVMRGHDLRNFCRDLLAHVRNLLVVKVASGGDELLETSAVNGDELARQASAFTESDLVYFFHSLTETESHLRTSSQPRYQLEIGLVKLAEIGRLAPLNEILERLNALETSLRAGKPLAAQTTPPRNTGSNMITRSGDELSGVSSSGASTDRKSAEATDAPASFTKPPALTLVTPPAREATLSNTGVASSSIGAATAAAAAAAAEQVDRARQIQPAVSEGSTGAIIEKIKTALEKRRRMLLMTALESASRVVIENDDLVIEFAPETKHLRDSLAKPESIKLLREIVREAVGRELNVRISIKEQVETDDASVSKQEAERREKQRLREIAEQHPAVQELLETFRGEIVDVRRIDHEQ
jgi:DNA polymerase-3 subunit gamma/tau